MQALVRNFFLSMCCHLSLKQAGHDICMVCRFVLNIVNKKKNVKGLFGILKPLYLP